MIVFLTGLFSIYIYDSIFNAYFIVGGAQLLSTVIRLLLDHERSKERKTYERALVWLFGITLIIVLFGFIVPGIIFFPAFGWLLITPIYAISYVIICLNETGQINVPQESHQL
jgi:hypothetical protein